jgi:hypothetical protein
MPSLKIVLAYLAIYPLLLCLCLKLFGVCFGIREPFAANVVCVLCVLIVPAPIDSWLTRPATLLAMRFLNDASLKNLFYPIAVSRLALVHWCCVN